MSTSFNQNLNLSSLRYRILTLSVILNLVCISFQILFSTHLIHLHIKILVSSVSD
jgi:hypothetical protein